MTSLAMPADARPANALRVLTHNIWGVRGDWPVRRGVLMDGVRRLGPDLIALQETIVTDDYDQVHDLLGELDDEYHVTHYRNREPDGQAISIASRWPIGPVRELDLRITQRAQLDSFACCALIAEVRAPEPLGPLLFVNHFPSWKLNFEYEREQQTALVARVIEERSDEHIRHVIVAGDLDADPEAASIRFWSGRQSLDGFSVCYQDAWAAVRPDEPGHTFTPENDLMTEPGWPFRRIDYVFVRFGEHGGPTLNIADCRHFLDEPVNGIWASDHFGVVADLRARTTPSSWERLVPSDVGRVRRRSGMKHGPYVTLVAS